MKHIDTILSPRYNLAFGYMPGLLAMLLAYFIPHEQAIYFGALTGIVASLFTLNLIRKEPKQVLLFSTTFMLILMSLSHFVSLCNCPHSCHAAVIEMAILLPAIVILLTQKGLRTNHPTEADKKHRYRITLDTLLVSAKISCIVFSIQIVITAICWLVGGTTDSSLNFVLFGLLPAVMISLTMLFNQLSLNYFNRMMRQVVVLPIVNARGDVIGKCLSGDSRKKYIHPLIRISVVYNGMELLHQRSEKQLSDKGKLDALIEGHLFFKESLEQGAYRMLREGFPKLPNDNLKFVSRYYMEFEGMKRLVYYFVLELEKDERIILPKLSQYKPWTLKQIEENIGKNLFSHYFEYEFDEHRRVLRDSMQRKRKITYQLEKSEKKAGKSQ